MSTTTTRTASGTMSLCAEHTPADLLASWGATPDAIATLEDKPSRAVPRRCAVCFAPATRARRLVWSPTGAPLGVHA